MRITVLQITMIEDLEDPHAGLLMLQHKGLTNLYQPSRQQSVKKRNLTVKSINDLPNCLRDAAPRMFADDTNITLSAKTVANLKLAVTSELNLTCWLRTNRLSLNVAKTELMIIGSRQRLNAQCEEIDVSIDDKMIKRVDHTKSLGLTIDAQLSWSKHVDKLCKKASSAIGALKRV